VTKQKMTVKFAKKILSATNVDQKNIDRRTTFRKPLLLRTKGAERALLRPNRSFVVGLQELLRSFASEVSAALWDQD